MVLQFKTIYLLASSVGSESAPHFNDVPVVLGSSSHGGERKRQGTCHNSTYEWGSPKGWVPKGGLSQLYCNTTDCIAMGVQWLGLYCNTCIVL